MLCFPDQFLTLNYSNPELLLNVCVYIYMLLLQYIYIYILSLQLLSEFTFVHIFGGDTLYYHTHRIHGAGIYANICGILMGSMLPYIAAPWILWDILST